jgi:hypothetical protein
VGVIDDKSLKIFQRKLIEEETKTHDRREMEEEFLVDEPLGKAGVQSRKLTSPSKVNEKIRNGSQFKPF